MYVAAAAAAAAFVRAPLLEFQSLILYSLSVYHENKGCCVLIVSKKKEDPSIVIGPCSI